MQYSYIRSTLSLLLLAFFTFRANSQIAEPITKLEQFLVKNKYKEIIDYYDKKGEGIEDEFYLKAYYLGLAYYYTPALKPQALSLLEDYVQNSPEEYIEQLQNFNAYYLLADMYHLTYQFSQAKSTYETFISKISGCRSIPGYVQRQLILEAERRIEWGSNAKSIVNNPRNVIIENLGDSINSKFPEYAPIVSSDEKKLIFTSRRPDTRGGRKVEGEGYFEDIYSADLLYGSLFEQDLMLASGGEVDFSIVTDFSYSNIKRLGDAVNSVSHDAGIQLSPDETELYFYRNSDIWRVHIAQDSIYGRAERIDVKFNSNFHEPSIFLSYDNDKIFLVSDKPGGYGGMDLYMSHMLEDGTWSDPQNLGPNVNTQYDEDAPYLDPDKKTLYFSSHGHSSMGGFDIFRCELDGNSATAPVNLGYPVNTTADDIFFTMTSKYNRGYYSSNNLDGRGDMDVYRISFADERDPISELKGYVKEGEELIPVKSQIIMKTQDGSEFIEEKTDPIDGSYYFVLGTGRTYQMRLETDGYAAYERDFVIPERKNYFRLFQEIHHIHLKNSNGDIIGQQITLHNQDGSRIEYEITDLNDSTKVSTFSSFTETKFYMTEDSLLQLLMSDPNLKFDLGENGVVEYIEESGSDMFSSDSYAESDLNQLQNAMLKINEIGADNFLQEWKNFEYDSLFFSVQVGSFTTGNADLTVLKKYDPIYSFKEKDGTLSCYSRKIKTYNSAQEYKRELLESGLEGAFVTAYYKGEKISTAEALDLLKLYGTSLD